jgi:cytochrome c oxidase subunit 3
MIWKKLKIQSKIVIVTKRVYQTKGIEGESLSSERENITPRVVPVATGRAFKERERKQELNKKPCLIQLRALIAREKAKHQAKVDEYNALRAQGLRRDPVRDSNLVSVLEIILEVNEEDENILTEQNAVKSTQMELSFLHIKTRHSFHLVDPSPWPIIASLGVFMLTAGSVLYMQKFIGGGLLVITGLALILFVMFTWWRDIIREATFEEQHTFAVQRGLRLGMVLFIVSEIMFFFAFFWAFFHSSLSPTFNIGGVWPPLSIVPIKTLGVPLTNTFFLLTSGATVTWAHHAVVARAKKHSLVALILTLVLALQFTGLQVFEYYDAPFAISDGIFGSCFYLTTGFHGFHVFVGTISLFVSFVRFVINHYTDTHHFGFESGIWYWHFVDVVWLFLFVTVYWWGGVVGAAPIGNVFL